VTGLASIETLYRTYGPAVYRRARTILGDDQAARDALQEVFVRALKAGAQFRDEASPTTWLYRVTTNYCLNQVRDAARRAQLLAAQGPRVEGATGTFDDRLVIARMLAAMPDELQEIAVYYYVDHMNQDEIAAIVGVSRRTIGNRLEAFRSSALKSIGTVP
jgi:RNA polymerase sigma-70 factor (ECF subfamily)